MIVNDAINQFLKHFNYLNAEGKRGSRLFMLFCNTALTNDNIKNAKHLKDSLNALVCDDSKTDQDKCAEFITLINASFDQVTKSRQDFAPADSYERDHDHGIYIAYDFKRPYQPAKFEKELCAGLQAVCNALNPQHIAMQECGLEQKTFLEKFSGQCQDILLNIRNFSPPKQITYNDRSYIP